MCNNLCNELEQLVGKEIKEKYLSKIINDANIGFVLCKASDVNSIIYANSFYYSFTGYTKEEIVGKNLSSLCVDENDKMKLVEIENSLKNQKFITKIIKNRKKSGDIFYNKLTISPIIDDLTNELKFYFAIHVDISKQIEEKKYFEKIINSTKSIICVTNGEELIKVNKRFFDIFGFENIDEFKLNHKCISDLFIKKDANYLLPIIKNKKWNNFLNENPDKFFNTCMLDKDNNERFFQVESSGKIFLNEDNDVITFTEITEIINQKKLLESQTKHAAMGEMISMIAHQWRQPLTTLSTIYAKINVLNKMNMLKGNEFDNAYKKSTQIVEYLSSTINDFRNFFSKDEIITKLSIDDVILNSFKIIAPSFESKDIDFQFIQTEFTKNTIIAINSSKFSQVLLNLLKNSHDALLENNIENKTIKLTVEMENEYLSIVLEDNAKGIPENIISKIFEPYFSTKSKNGTGLGLYMSKIIIEEHLKGELSVKNSENGALFKILLPKKLIKGE